MRNFFIAGLLCVLASFQVCADDNAELSRMYAADQAARKTAKIDWSTVNKQDAERRATVMSILRKGEVRTAKDYYYAAMIFQHGDTADDIRLAHAFASIASALDADSSRAHWLKAASWDRLMLRFNQSQWYGTQFVKDPSGKWALYPVQPGAITDEQRAAWSVPSLAQAEARAESMNSPKLQGAQP